MYLSISCFDLMVALNIIFEFFDLFYKIKSYRYDCLRLVEKREWNIINSRVLIIFLS